MSKILLPIIIALASGCSENKLVTGDNDEGQFGDGLIPDISVSPPTLNFGELKVLKGEIATQTVTVQNVGEGDLQIADLNIIDDGLNVYTLSSISSTLIQPSATAQFTVTFAPLTDATNNAAVVIDSNDPDEPAVEVPLQGDGIAPVIQVTPLDYDFGMMYIGCDDLQPVTVSNIGRDDLLVETFAFNTGSEDFSFSSAEEDFNNGPLPWTLEPGQDTDVYVTYAPIDDFSDNAYLFVNSNDPFTPEVMATQDGSGQLFGENTDIFEQPLQAQTDILFAVDKSTSMDDDIMNVQANFQAYTSTLDALNADFRIGIVVADSGQIAGSTPFIDSNNAADAVAIATDMLDGGGTNGGYYTEAGFSLLTAGISANQEWLREDAKLNLIGISDEPEQSPNSYSYYVSEFQSVKDDPDDVVVHAIGGDYPNGCATAEPYTGFYEATVATGGLFLSLCATDWGSHLTQLAEESAAPLNVFDLSQWPVPETIVVVVDSQVKSIGWDYDETDNAVLFETDYLPEGGSIIEISYAILSDCDM